MSLETCQTSGVLAVGTTVVSARPCKISGIVLNPAAAACSVTIYDNPTAGSGTVIAILTATANGPSATNFTTLPIECKSGATAVVAGTGAQANVYFSAL